MTRERLDEWVERVLHDVRDRVIEALDDGDVAGAIAMSGWKVVTDEALQNGASVPTWEELTDEERAKLTAMWSVQLGIYAEIIRAHGGGAK